MSKELYLVSSWGGGFAWSDKNISCVRFRDRNTSVWTECFCTSCVKTEYFISLDILLHQRPDTLKRRTGEPAETAAKNLASENGTEPLVEAFIAVIIRTSMSSRICSAGKREGAVGAELADSQNRCRSSDDARGKYSKRRHDVRWAQGNQMATLL